MVGSTRLPLGRQASFVFDASSFSSLAAAASPDQTRGDTPARPGAVDCLSTTLQHRASLPRGKA